MTRQVLMRHEMIDLLEDAEQIDTMEGKHDETYKRFLFTINDKKWAAWIAFSYNNGIEDGPYELTSVVPVEKTVVEWVDEDPKPVVKAIARARK